MELILAGFLVIFILSLVGSFSSNEQTKEDAKQVKDEFLNGGGHGMEHMANIVDAFSKNKNKK